MNIRFFGIRFFALAVFVASLPTVTFALDEAPLPSEEGSVISSETPPATDPLPPDPPVVEPETATPPPTNESLPVEPTPETFPTEPATVESPAIDPLPLEEPDPAPPEPDEEVIVPVIEEPTPDYSADYDLYKKYLNFGKYEKRVLYQKYERYSQVAWRAVYFENNKKEKKYLKSLKKKYKNYTKKPVKYARFASAAREYVTYSGEKAEYFALKPYSGYSSLALYNRSEYDQYKNFGTAEYKAGYERYLALIAAGLATDRGDADLPSGPLGPEIPVGIYALTPSDLRETSFRISATEPISIQKRSGEEIATIPANTRVKVKYIGDKKFRIANSETDALFGEVSKEVNFVAEGDTAIFDVNRPGSSFDRYRGDMKLRYYDSPEADGDRVWVINILPLEHYVAGMGEITGTGPDEYDEVMTTLFRTYGYWKLKWSTKYADQGFKVDASSGNQVYLGYDWEITHPDIPKAAAATRGQLVMYDREVALTPYSSWTDGETRRFEDGHWGRSCKTSSGKTSSLYPWLSSVTDARGKHESESTCSLASKGNHMVGLSANGAVRMAKYDNLTNNAILEHYYGGIDLVLGY